MPYEPDPVSDDSQKSITVQTGSSSISLPGNQPGKRDEPRGIARYFQPQAKGAQVQPRQQVIVPANPMSPAGTPATPSLLQAPSLLPAPSLLRTPSLLQAPSLLQTPSRIAVIINSSSQQKTSPRTSRDASEDSLDALVTSDITPLRRPGPSTVPSTTPLEAPSTATPRGRPPSTTTTPRGKPPSTVPHTAPPTTAAPPQTQTPATLPPKRRGRPVGWRPGMGGYSTQASTPGGTVPTPTTKQQRTGPPKKRGRPPGRPGVKPPRAIFEKLRPRYVPFLCEWSGCPAELQNVDTLRRHVAVVHGREGREGCRWGRCGQAAPGTRFTSGKEFERHVEMTHLLPFVWHVGDGPRNSVMEYKVRTPDEEADDLPGYLFDEEGNQVTPSVLHQEFENDEERKERRRRLHRLMLERDRNAPAEEQASEDEADLVEQMVEPGQ